MTHKSGHLNGPHQTDTTSDGAYSLSRTSQGTEREIFSAFRDGYSSIVHSILHEHCLFPAIEPVGIPVRGRGSSVGVVESRICRLQNKWQWEGTKRQGKGVYLCVRTVHMYTV